MKKILTLLFFITLITIPYRASATILLDKNFNSGPLNQNFFSTTCVTSQDPNDLTHNLGYLTTENSQDGGMSFKAIVRKTDPICANSHRTEMNTYTSSTLPFASTWVSWDTFQPSTQPDDPVPFSSGQMHGYNSVPFSVWFYNSSVKFVIQNTGLAGSVNKVYDLGVVPKGKWYKWVIHYKRSAGSDGFFQLWLDGVQRVNYIGSTMDVGETMWYFKFGIYKWNLMTSIYDSAVSYTDNIKFGDENSVLSDFIGTADTTPPTGTLTVPTTGATVAGTVTLSATATDNVAVSAVNFFQGTTLITADTTSPYATTWDTTKVPNGTYQVKGIIIDSSGNTNTTNIATVTVNNQVADTTPPQVGMISPVSGATVSGAVTLTASASDASGISKVEFYQGATLMGVATSAPYTTTWNTVFLPNGTYSLHAVAYDTSGNRTTSGSISVVVANTNTGGIAVSLATPVPGTTLSGTIALSATTIGANIVRVEFFKDSDVAPIVATASQHTAFFDTSSLTNGTHSFRAIAYTASGGSSVSPSVSVTINNKGKGAIANTPASVASAPTTPGSHAGIGKVLLSWGAPLTSGGSAITSYTITALPGGMTTTTTSREAVVGGLSSGTAYTFSIRATTLQGAGAAISLTATPLAAFTLGTTVQTHVTTSLNVRQSPGGAKVGSVTSGVTGTVLAVSGDWTQVRFPSVTGWVSSAYIFAQ